MTSPRTARGFTLLEVMVALAVLALALTAASDVVGGALRNHVRARQLDVATILARGKLAELEAAFELDGFRDFDQKDEGTFEAEGHPEVTWQAEAVKPQVDLGPDGVLKALTGMDGGVAGLLGLDASSLQGAGGGAGASGAAGPSSSLAGALSGASVGLIQGQLTALGEQIKQGVRELRLTVAWPDGKVTESFTVVTHLVVLTPGSQQAQQPAGTTTSTTTGRPPAAPGGGAMSRAAPGFSLIEVMIAVAITAVIGAMAAGVFQQVDHAASVARDQGARYAGARLALTRMTRELSMAFLSEHYDRARFRDRPTLFKGDGETVLFTTMAHVRLAQDAKESDQAVVEYLVERNRDTDEDALYRREKARIDDEPDRGGRKDLVADHVQKLSLRYWDLKRKEWVREWSTRTPERLNGLPTRVQIELDVKLADGRTEKFVTQARVALTAPLEF